MFRNKNNLPPRLTPPVPEQILEDLENASKDDAIFKVLRVKGKSDHDEDMRYSTNTNDPESVYRKVKTYLDVNQRLKDLDETLERESESLKRKDEEMKKLAQDIRKQAQEALVKW